MNVVLVSELIRMMPKWTMPKWNRRNKYLILNRM
jgi:hypothetical protein